MKLKTFLFIAIMSLTLSSCFKTRNCKCTTVTVQGPDNYGPQPGTSVQNQSLGGNPFEGNGGKKNQEAQCKGMEFSDSYSTKSCELTK